MNTSVDELLDRLSPEVDEVAPDWKQVLALARVGTIDEAPPPPEPQRGTRSIALAVVGFAVGVAALVLLLIAPWRIGPSIVDRALAALTIKPGTILHIKYVTTQTDVAGTSVTIEAWIGPQGQFRAIIRPGLFGVRAWEVGAHAGKMNLRFNPATNTITNLPGGGLVVLVRDIAASISHALASGTSTADGITTIRGRRVERIRTYRFGDCTGQPKTTFLYVDPRTHYPVEYQGYQYEEPTPGGPFHRWRITRRFLTYEYLPATQRNLKLTSVEAEHPHARLEGSPNVPFNWTPSC